MPAGLDIRPANRAGCTDLDTVFGTRGPGASCRCQRYKLAPKEAFQDHPPAVRADRLRQQTECGHPRSSTTSGLVAYLDADPVGWCAVEPRPAYAGLLRVYRVPWDGRDEVKTDESVWAVTCVFVRAGFRRRGIGTELVCATVPFARDRGARALEGYPMTVPASISEELHVGTLAMFERAGFGEVARPSQRRAVMRADLSATAQR